MKNRGTLARLTGCLVAVVTIVGFAPLAHARKAKSLCVAPSSGSVSSSCFGTIRAALKHARSGDSITIAAGTYVENVHIGKNSKKGEKISLTITGAGAGSTIIDGGANGTVVSIFPQADVTLSGVTVQNGSAGGIAVRDGTLNLTNCAVTNNQTTGSGGGIDFAVSNHLPKTAPQLNIDNCTISGNTANGANAVFPCGGGLASNGSANIINSTISGNTALGGVSPERTLFYGSGGGLCLGGQTTIANTTISGNQATGNPTGGEPEGGGIIYDAPLVLNNVTVANNSVNFGIGKGGGIFGILGAAATVSNTILALNTAHDQLDCGGILGNLISQGHNLIQNNACDISGDTTTNILDEDPMLESLQLNAPGTTETQALMAGSPAIGAGAPGTNNSTGAGPQCLPTDQRGVTRPTDACDIGAYQTSM